MTKNFEVLCVCVCDCVCERVRVGGCVFEMSGEVLPKVMHTQGKV